MSIDGATSGYSRADERDLRGVEMRYPNGQAWSGACGFDYVREAAAHQLRR